MPIHRPGARRSRGLRLLLSVVIGTTAFLAIGSVAAGTTPPPTEPASAGAVAGAIDPPAIQAIQPGPTAPAATTVEDSAAIATTAVVAPQTLHDGSDTEPPGPPSLASLTGYRWPLAHGRLTLPFGPTPWGSRIVAGERFHDGIDLATVCGDRIVAAHSGVVIAAGRHYDGAMGWVGDLTAYYRRLDAKKLWSTLPIVVVIDDGNGYRSVYAHFGKIVVKTGQAIVAGSLLGYEGQTGRASGCHLHYGLFSPLDIRTFAIDPAVVKRMKVPPEEIARIDPLRVLPDRRKGVSAADTGER